MINEKEVLRDKIENLLKKCEQWDDIILIFANSNQLTMFSINNIVYVNEDNCLFRLDHMLSEHCQLGSASVKRYLQAYIEEDYVRLKVSDVLKFCYSGVA